MLNPKEKTPTEIREEKMAAMAADPNAETVYWTETGPDPAGWDIIFPEYKVLTEAFLGGYGWFDLTEGRGRHLLPKPKPYKVVNISNAELTAIHAKETAVVDAQNAKRLDEEKERKAMIAEEERMRALMAEEHRAVQKSKEDAETIQSAVARILTDIRALPVESLYMDFLVDFIVDGVSILEHHLQRPVAAQVIKVVEKEQLLFVTPCGSPNLPPVSAPPDPSPLSLAPLEPLSPALMEKILGDYKKIRAFLQSPWIVGNGVTYVPTVDSEKGYHYIRADLILPASPPIRHPQQGFCGNPYCAPPLPKDPPPPLKGPLLLPVVKARIVWPLSRLPTAPAPPAPAPAPAPVAPSIVMKKLDMPSQARLRKFLRPRRPSSKKVTWSDREEWFNTDATLYC